MAVVRLRENLNVVENKQLKGYQVKEALWIPTPSPRLNVRVHRFVRSEKLKHYFMRPIKYFLRRFRPAPLSTAIYTLILFGLSSKQRMQFHLDDSICVQQTLQLARADLVP